MLKIDYQTDYSPTGYNLDLSDTVRVSKHHTNLRGSCALLRQLADLINHLIGGSFQPCWRSPGVWYGAVRDTFAFTVKASHAGGGLERLR